MNLNIAPKSRFRWLASLSVAALFLAAISFYPSSSDAQSTSKTESLGTPFLYDNGGLATGATSNSGVAAPAGTQWSEAQNETGNTTQSNTLAGVGCAVSTTANLFRCADDFTVPAGATWTIDQVAVFVYQTGFAGTTSPVSGATLRIWNGRPGDAGAAIIFGDTTTNRLGTSTDSSLWRIFNSSVPTGTAPATNRRIWDTRINVAPALALTAGTYWIDWDTRIGTNTAHFAPPVTIPGVRGLAGWNARQFTATGWISVVDDGNPTTSPDFPQDFPFKLVGTSSGGPATGNGRADFDGDGRTDVSVFRGSEGNWYLNQSTAGFAALNWGLAGDVLIPADYDGDGKTDIAVFRGTADASQPDFYILNSNGFTVSGYSWGIPGDVPVSSDYDGDGKADIGVYRASEGNWYILLSSNGNNVIVNNPGTTPVPADYDGDGNSDGIIFTDGAWVGTLSTGPQINISFGQAGDIPVPGDFDGDGKVDQAVYRPGEGNWYVLRSSDSQTSITRFGISTEIPAPGHYDGDGSDDYAIYRGGVWWINGSTAGVSQIQFGIATDNPIVTAARP